MQKKAQLPSQRSWSPCRLLSLSKTSLSSLFVRKKKTASFSSRFVSSRLSGCDLRLSRAVAASGVGLHAFRIKMWRRFLWNLGVTSISNPGVAANAVSPFEFLCRRCISRTVNNFTNDSTKLLFGENSNEKLRLLINNISVKLNMLGIVLTQQCNRVASLRLRRAYQILLLYQRIYGEQLLMQKIKSQMRCKGRPLLALFSATIFQWEKERVSDEELQK